MNWTELLEAELEVAYGTTEKLLDRVDSEGLDWKPSSGQNWMTMGQLLKHLTESCGIGCRGFVTGDWGMPDGVNLEDLSLEEMLPPAEKLPTVESVEEARQLLSADKKLALQMIQKAGEDQLATRELAAPWDPGEKYPLGRHLLSMIQHLERHKTQLFYYLKLQDVPVSTVDLWG